MQKFFCDNCGTQVDRNQARCPRCGRYFKSVRCPKCGLTGNPEMFINGCPSCGYAEERMTEGEDYFDLQAEKGYSGRKIGKKRTLSEQFYKRILPLLILLFIVLVIILIRISL